MKKMKMRITITMIFSSICICILFMLVTNIAASKYIDIEAKKAIEKNDVLHGFVSSIATDNSILVENSAKIVEISDAEKIGDTINETFLSDGKVKIINNIGLINENASQISDDYIESNLFDVRYFFYSENDIKETQITRYLSYDDQNIYSLIKDKTISEGNIKLCSINNREYYVKLIKYDIDNSISSNLYSQNIVMYVPITSIKNIVDNVNLIFVFLTLISVLIFGFAGLKSGEYIENSQKKMKHFFENASHELKTPLMSIQGYAEGVKTNIISLDEGIDTILRQSDKMQVLIDEILNLSKIDSGQLSLNSNEINLYYLINDLVDDLADIITLNISVINNIDKDIPLIIGDEVQIAKAFKTIIYNGIKFAKDKVIIKSRCEKNKIYISVEDDGAGISDEDIANIFDRFYSKNNLSNGIGLAMAKEIFKLSKGNIEAISGDRGVFIIELPIAK